MRLINADDLLTKIRRLPNAGTHWFVSTEAVFDAILKAPTIEPQPEVTEEAIKDYCRKRCLTILTNDYFHKLTSEQTDLQQTCNKLATDCISRQEALEPYQTLDDSDTICIWLLRKNIEQMPSAQPEIIRCRDCKYASNDEYCHCSKVTWWNSKDDFCSRAERKEDVKEA